MSSRRNFIRKLSLVSAGLSLIRPGSAAAESKPYNEGFSFVHLTDMHVRRKRQGHTGYRACIDTVNKADKNTDFVLMGGDLAFDGNYTAKDEFIDQIELYKSISDTLKMPYYNSLGNHDVLGWNSRRKVSIDDPDIGKKLIMDKLNLEKSYYSFNHKGWHFIILDSIHPVESDHGLPIKPRLVKSSLSGFVLILVKIIKCQP